MLSGFKFLSFFLFVILLILCSIPPTISEEIAETTTLDIVNDYERPTIIDNKGHGLHGLRGGIIFSEEDQQGYGYTHNEVLMNIQKIYGDG